MFDTRRRIFRSRRDAVRVACARNRSQGVLDYSVSSRMGGLWVITAKPRAAR